MKKSWIKVKRGILEPKHRRALGASWFLYFYMLDKANWENGTIYDWKDEAAADDLEMPVSTLRTQRRNLEDHLYIQTNQKRYNLEITITNWTNPREYQKVETDKKPAPRKQEGDNQGDNQGTQKLTGLHSIHIITSSHKNSGVTAAPEVLSETEVDVMDKPKKLGDIIDGMQRYAKPEDPAARFPEDCRAVVREFIRLWKVEPLSGQIGYWVEGARDVREACKEFGLRAIQQAYQDYNTHPFMVSSPGSILKLVQAAAGKLRQGGVTPKADYVCTWCKGTGVIVKPSDPIEYRPDGGIRNVEAPCPRCGKESE